MDSKKNIILGNKGAEWHLRLYIAGHTPKSIKAIDNIKNYCEQHLTGKYFIEVIDLLQDPQLAEDDQILAIPTLVRRLPAPIRQVIGDLSNEEKVLLGLNIIPAQTVNAGSKKA